jgi:hypothetical protein
MNRQAVLEETEDGFEYYILPSADLNLFLHLHSLLNDAAHVEGQTCHSQSDAVENRN